MTKPIWNVNLCACEDDYRCSHCREHEEEIHEYVDYLENELSLSKEANNLLVKDYDSLKKLADKIDIENHSLLSEGKELLKENEKLKKKLAKRQIVIEQSMHKVEELKKEIWKWNQEN